MWQKRSDQRRSKKWGWVAPLFPFHVSSLLRIADVSISRITDGGRDSSSPEVKWGWEEASSGDGSIWEDKVAPWGRVPERGVGLSSVKEKLTAPRETVKEDIRGKD